MAKTIQCDIVSAEGNIYSGAVELLSAVGVNGELGVLPGHAPLLTELKPGPVRVIEANGQEQVFYVSGGMLEIQPKIASILADTAQRADNVDEAAAEQAKKEALEALMDQKSDMDYSFAAAQLAEAMAQLRALQKLRK